MDTATMRARRRERWRGRAERVRDAFGLVFVLVLTTYVLASLLNNYGWEAVILAVSASATSVIALTSSHARPRLVRSAIWLSALTIGLTVIGALTDDRNWLNFAALVQILLLSLAMAAVLQRVVTTTDRVGARTILGAISVYVALGLIFTFAYGAIDRIQSGPFFEGVTHPAGNDFLFFSYTTLTTTGYGDLVPGGQPGRMISGLEMMIGQIFLVTLVAGLVALWRPGEGLRRRQEEKRGKAAAPAPE
jgi:hypothetical protein